MRASSLEVTLAHRPSTVIPFRVLASTNRTHVFTGRTPTALALCEGTLTLIPVRFSNGGAGPAFVKATQRDDRDSEDIRQRCLWCALWPALLLGVGAGRQMVGVCHRSLVANAAVARFKASIYFKTAFISFGFLGFFFPSSR